MCPRPPKELPLNQGRRAAPLTTKRARYGGVIPPSSHHAHPASHHPESAVQHAPRLRCDPPWIVLAPRPPT